MASDPRILAAFVQGTLDAVEHYESRRGAARIDAVARDTRTRIREAARITWLPLAEDLALTQALFDAAGRDAARGVFRELMTDAMEERFLRALVQGAAALMGRSPERLVRWAPRVWSAVYRDAGSLAPVERPAGAGLELRDAPAEMLASPVYLEGTCAAVEGGMSWFGIEAHCRLERDGERPLIAVAWKPAAST